MKKKDINPPEETQHKEQTHNKLIKLRK